MTDPNNEQNNLSPKNAGESNLEDTKPRRIAPRPEEPAGEKSNFDATTAVPVSPDRQNTVIHQNELDHTRPTPVGEPGENIDLGFEHTIPPPAGFGLEVQPDAENQPGATVFETPPAQALPPVEAQPPVPPTHRLPGKRVVRKKKAARRRIPQWVLIPALGLLGILLVAVLSAAGGYFAGEGARVSAQQTQTAGQADVQFQKGLEDMAAGDYLNARRRFEFVIQINPGYPGATEKLAEALAYLNATATPTLAPEPTVTPTPDTRANDDLYNQAQQAILNKNWDDAVDALLSLRANDPNFRPIDIDGMLYLAMRNRGKDKIVSADLESGIYDLSLAAKFGPLDSEAKGLLDWSQLYITGASFWEIDWAQVVQYFSQVAPSMPNLMDASRMTASERYRQGLFEYGNQLASQGKFCQAVQQYQQSLQIAQNAEVQSAWEQAANRCGGAEGGGGQGGGQETPEPEGGGGNKQTPQP